jgi:phenylalanyl-tRNA synthetase alpha chain
VAPRPSLLTATFVTLDPRPSTLADLEARLAAVPGLDARALEAEHTAILGRRSGALTALLRSLPTLPVEERKAFGAAVNALKARFEQAFAHRQAELRTAAREAEGQEHDLTMPARRRWTGGWHPVTRVVDRVVAICRGLGFTVATGPEVEDEWYNFFALNFPPDHPALDQHDTLYLETGAEGRGSSGEDRELHLLLRTHTSPVQIRVMQAGPPPYRVVIPGFCYRKDPFDASHAPAFHQIEGLAVDEGIGFVDLKATLTHFAHRFFGPGRRVRFRPSFFPFTEPSAEMDVECGLCGGAGCGACKGTGWMEIMGCGMVHPVVLRNAGVDPERYTGWAFGMGPGRLAMTLYGIPDIRLLYEGDMRFLRQFEGASA